MMRKVIWILALIMRHSKLDKKILTDEQLNKLTTFRLIQLSRSLDVHVTSIEKYGFYYDELTEKELEQEKEKFKQLKEYKQRIQNLLTAREHVNKGVGV